MELLRGYPPAVRLLGEPIRAKHIDLGTGKTYCDGLTAKLTVPVRGRKKKGILYSWASRSNVDERWAIDRLDLEVSKRTWTFYVNPNKSNADSQSPGLSAADMDSSASDPVQHTSEQFLYSRLADDGKS